MEVEEVEEVEEASWLQVVMVDEATEEGCIN